MEMLSPARIGLLLLGVYVVLRTIGLDPVPPLASRLGTDANVAVVVAPLPNDRNLSAPEKLERRASHVHAVPRVVSRHKHSTTRTTAPRTAVRTIAQPSSRTPGASAAPTVDEPLRDATPTEPKRQPAPSATSEPAPAVLPAATPAATPPVHLPDPPQLPLPDPTALVDPGALQPVVVPLAPLPAVPALP
jgi:hypothetical protein